MKLFVRNGFIVAEAKGLPRTERSLWEWMKNFTEAEFYFLDETRKGDIDKYFPAVNLESGLHKIPYKPFQAYRELAYIQRMAVFYNIEQDESFTEVYEALKDEYETAYKRCEEEYKERRKALAEERWNEKAHPKKESCDGCLYCGEGVDGDLYCAKYVEWLEVQVGEKVTPSGKHLMFASHGIPLDGCKHDDEVALEKEKEQFIQAFASDYTSLDINVIVAKEMNEGVGMYV